MKWVAEIPNEFPGTNPHIYIVYLIGIITISTSQGCLLRKGALSLGTSHLQPVVKVHVVLSVRNFDHPADPPPTGFKFFLQQCNDGDNLLYTTVTTFCLRNPQSRGFQAPDSLSCPSM